MDLTSLPYFALLRQRLDVTGERQRLIAENLANAATPGFTPRDVDLDRFDRAMAAVVRGQEAGKLALTRTQRGHVSDVGGSAPAATIRNRPDSETTIDGNSVVLEEQLIKANENRAAYELGLSLYQKGLQMVRAAARAPR